MISTVEKVLFLKSVDLFSQIPGEDLAQIAGISQEIEYQGGELIIQEGDMGDSLYLVLDGEVLVHKKGQDISRLGERQAFGEMAILDNEPRSASVTAASDVVCLKVDREDFYELMTEKPEIAHGIIRVLSKRLRCLNLRLSDSAPPAA